MVNLNKYSLVKTISAAIIALGLGTSTAQAADIALKVNLPAHENCASATYISGQWNVETKRANANKAIAYKKLICKSGREAYVLVYGDDKKLSYKLVDHSNVTMSDQVPNMCKIVDKYCKQ